LARQEWKRLLRGHRRFVASIGHTPGDWQVLVASDLPLAIWSGPADTEGEQLNLKLANLSGLDLSFANLSVAALVGAVAEGVTFRGADLDHSLLTDAFLDGADFSIANLNCADLSRASLRGASFQKAVLTGADFENCDLAGADFTGASMLGASFVGAELGDVVGFPLPVFDGDDPDAELALIADRFRGFELKLQVEEFTKRHDHETLCRSLLAALRRGELPFGREQNLWLPLTAPQAVTLCDAEDFIRLTLAIAAGAPNEAVAGRVSGLHHILRQKHEARDDAFFERLDELRSELPEPYASGVECSLVELRSGPSRAS